MHHQIRKRLTYANVMSSIAVFLILGGASALAASQLGKNSVGSKQLKKNAVTTAKIKKNAVTNAKIKKDAVTGNKVKDQSLTGSDINLGTLGTVPSATNAQHAALADNSTSVGGMTAFRIYSAQPPGTSEQTILSANGFKITAACSATEKAVTAFVVAPKGTPTLAESQGNNDTAGGPFTREDEEEEGGSEADLTGTEEHADGGSTFTASTLGGKNISGQIEFKPANETYGTGHEVCVVSGYAFVGG